MPRVIPRRDTYQARVHQRDFFVVRALAEFLRHHVNDVVAPGIRLLDIGCGEQPLRATVERLGGSYVGLDVVQNASATVHVVGRGVDVPFADRSADAVLCTEVLEHVPDPGAVIREIARVLRPGGRAIITSPFMFPLHEEPHDCLRITSHQLRRLFAQNGLEVMVLETAGNELEVIATVWCNLWSGLGHASSWAPRVALKAWRVLVRLPVNLGVVLGSACLGRLLPRKSYLSTMCVVRKPE